MNTLDQELKQAFSEADKKSNYQWLTDDQADKPFKATKRGYMSVPLNKETFEEMQAATTFTEQWRTQPKQVMKKARLFRVNLYMFGMDGKKHHRIAQMEDCDTVHVLWGAIDEMSMAIMTDDKNKDVEWDVDRCKAVVRV